MIVNFGINPPVGEIYHAVENPKGELGFYLVSKGEGHPWKCKIRSPSFNNLKPFLILLKVIWFQMLLQLLEVSTR